VDQAVAADPDLAHGRAIAVVEVLVGEVALFAGLDLTVPALAQPTVQHAGEHGAWTGVVEGQALTGHAERRARG
jgi:hypothetical protein